MPKTVWFVRHAQSLANADKNYRADDFSVPTVPLTPEGLKQAQEVAGMFDEKPDLVITSSYLRTKQTAKPLIEKYPGISCLEWSIHEFTYLSLGRCFNTTFAERKPLREEYWDRNDPFYNDGEGAESFNDFMSRVRNTIEALKIRKEKFIVLFSHEYTISAVKYLLEKQPKEITPKEMHEFRKYFSLNRVPNTSKIAFIF